MLKEKINYKDTLPINILTAEIEEYPIHFHDDIEVVYVLDGMVTLRNGYYSYTLKEGDIYILNDREIHSFEKIEGEENMVMMLQMDLTYFGAYYDNLKNNFFVTDMDDDDDESLDVLRNILARVMMEVLQKGYGYEQKVIESMHNLIGSLQSDFRYFLMEDGRFVNETKKKGNKILAGRLNRITDYMYDNYYRKLTLNEIAQKEHLSIYYLSHVIKEATGLSFQDLLSFIRVEESEKLLLGTNKKIGVIAEETGFSAVRYYVKHFETWFGMHPMEYRKKYTGKVKGRESASVLRRCTPTEIEEAIRNQVKGVYTDYLKQQRAEPVIVELDLNDEDAFRMDTGKKTCIETLAGKDNFKPVASIFNIVKELREEIIDRGTNHIVSAEVGSLGSRGLSVAFFNIDDELAGRLKEMEDIRSVYEEVKSYNKEIEILLRLNGLAGEFKVSRYRVTAQNCITAYEQVLNRREESLSPREAVLKEWMALPEVESRVLSATEVLNIRSALRGFSGELVLIDPIE